MKLLKIACCLLFLTQNNEYTFTRQLTYEVTDYKNPKKNRTVTYLLNDENNSYHITLNNISKKQDELILLHYDELYWKGQINKEDLKKPNITLEKGLQSGFSNPYKYQVDNYDFTALKDTILNHKVCKRFILKSNDPVKEKKKKLGREVYVIDTSSESKPLLTFCTAYEIWKQRKNIPNGVIVEKYFYNYKKELVFKETLKSSDDINVRFHFI